MLDAATEILPLALNYLGKDPNGENAEDLAAAEQLIMGVRPYIRYFHSSQYIDDLAAGEVCLVIGWSGDVMQAKARAAEAQNPQEIAYSIPNGGTLLWFDMIAIPADAPHPDAAHAFINFVLEPKVMAGITNYVAYANAVPESLQYVDEEIKNDPTVFPSSEMREKFFVAKALSPATERDRNRVWTRIRSGQ
jgi:putrescine transport system substrate-binding protein